MGAAKALLNVALDLTATLGASDRYRRLLEAVREVVPCDAAALLEKDGETLVPLAVRGLSPATLGLRFRTAEHPRLAEIAAARAPIRFPSDSPLPDPFDGLLADDPSARHAVHACLGCPLVVEGRIVGVLTADARDPHAFDQLDEKAVEWMAALAGAVLRTNRLIEALEEDARRSERVARDVVREAQERHGELLGASAAVTRVRREIDLFGRSDFPVLVTGETGVGKELVARGLHAASSRRDRALLHVNCAALPETVAESELFGHVRGAFTGATADRPGKFEVADRGTILLDEVGELPLAVQPKLLRVLQEGEIQRVGADRVLKVDVRVIAATNRDLVREVAEGRFRADLYHRLRVCPIHVPPLRERREDVAPLAGRFCEIARRRLGCGPVRIDASALAAFARYDWPGNARELENVLSRSVLHASAGVPRGEPVVVGAAHLGAEFVATAAEGAATPATSPAATAVAVRETPAAPVRLRDAVEELERRLVREAVAAEGGNWAAAARRLGLHRANLHRLAARLGIEG
jgi:anaerobic nitric oxide reductase transcription regulator